MLKKYILLTSAAILLLGPPAARASHIPFADVPILWTPLPGAGYLNFTEPGPGPFGMTEDFTGFTALPSISAGDTNDWPVDNGITHGDHADFDYVVENRLVEVGSIAGPPPPPGDNHPGIVGYMEWGIGVTTPSAHAGHGHDVALPVCPGGFSYLCLGDFAGPTFDTVDVFSIISEGDPFVSDTGELSARDAALDYEMLFCGPGFGCAPGALAMVFIPGWHPVATADDYVARWTSPFAATHVIIDPAFVGADGSHPDQVTQIDALVVSSRQHVPEPGTVLLLAAGLILLAGARNRMA